MGVSQRQNFKVAISVLMMPSVSDRKVDRHSWFALRCNEKKVKVSINRNFHGTIGKSLRSFKCSRIHGSHKTWYLATVIRSLMLLSTLR